MWLLCVAKACSQHGGCIPRRNIRERTPCRSRITFYDLTSSHRASFMLHPLIQGSHWVRPGPREREPAFTSCCRRAYEFRNIAEPSLKNTVCHSGTVKVWQKALLNCFPERGAHRRWAQWYSSFWGQMSGLGLERWKRGPAEDWGNVLAGEEAIGDNRGKQKKWPINTWKDDQ